MNEPRRMLDDPALSDALRSDLGHATNVEVDGLDMPAGLARLQQAVAVEPAAAASGGMAVSTKLIVGAAIVGGAVALWAATRPASAPDSAQAAPASVVAEASLESETPPGLAPASRSDEVASDHAAPRQVEREQEAPVTADVTAETAPPEEPAPSNRSDDPRSNEPARSHDKSRRRSHAPAVSDVQREAKLVAQARRDLATDPARALATTERLSEEFAHGVLVEERQAIAIRALARLGRTEEARRRAHDFLQHHGDGPHADAVRRSIR
jgi:hypothetical protein